MGSPDSEHSAAEARLAAMNLLARRDHSGQELRRKLQRKGYAEVLITRTLEGLARDRLIDDARFAQAYVEARAARGAGPLRIRMELRERGVDEQHIADCVDPHHSRWRTQVRRVREKRFGSALPGDYQERARQARFLQYRGFSNEHIQQALEHEEWD
jgi:regulatory protein